MLEIVKAELDRLRGKVRYHLGVSFQLSLEHPRFGERADGFLWSGSLQSWIVDGFPRTLHQGELLDSVLNEEVSMST